MTRAGNGKDTAIHLRYVMDEPTFLDATHALWEWGRKQKRVRLRTWLLLAALPITGYLALAYGMWFTFFAVVALALLHFVFDWPLSRAFARRGFARLPIANAPLAWRIDENGLEVRVGAGNRVEKARYSWDALTTASEHTKGFVLHHAHNVHHWLPKAAFASDADVARLRRLLQRRGLLSR